MEDKGSLWHNHLSKVLSLSYSLLRTIPSGKLRICSCSAHNEGRDGLAVLWSVLPPWTAWEILHTKGKPTDTKDSNFPVMPPVFIYQHLRAFEISQFLNQLKVWPVFQTGTSMQVASAGQLFIPTDILAQIIKHFSTLVKTTPPFSFFYIVIILSWDPSCRITYIHKLQRGKALQDWKALMWKVRRTYSSACPPQWSTSASSNCPATTGAMSTSIPSKKKQPVLSKQEDEGWHFHGKESGCPLLTRGGQDRKPLH